MSSRLAYEAILARWVALWTHTATALGNAVFEPVSGTPWVRLTVLDGAGRQVTIGSPGKSCDRHDGVIALQIFTPADEGESRARWLADAAAIVFRKQAFDGITCLVPRVTAIGNEGAWFQMNVDFAFWREELT